jgi:hypothetical protein
VFPKMQQIDQELTRANTARVAYIAWRMADVPGLYQNLMPVTYSLRELYIAERQIRAQLAADLKWLATTPAQRSGIAPWAMLDDDDFKGADREEFDRDLCLREYKEMGPIRDLRTRTGATTGGGGGVEPVPQRAIRLKTRGMTRTKSSAGRVLLLRSGTGSGTEK